MNSSPIKITIEAQSKSGFYRKVINTEKIDLIRLSLIILGTLRCHRTDKINELLESVNLAADNIMED